ncbi:hypothetical protein HOD38_04660 [archaeon]|jgi:hypothetical protein|nr:hypothetical protein [archaeon]MBT4397534.1 hypothetical protein [archaeon]MBT4440791.1 hypothetical protein [archaeon]
MDDDKGLGFRFIYATRKNPYDKKATLLHSAGLGLESAMEEAWALVEQMPIIHLWYQVIAEANGFDPKEPEVAEAYWLGSELLDHLFDYSCIHRRITDRFPHAEPRKPNNAIPPHHNLHVSHYGIVSEPDVSAEERTACLVIPAKSLDGVARFESLLDERELKVRNPFGYLIENSNPVAIHKDVVCAVLSNEQNQNLQVYGFELQG